MKRMSPQRLTKLIYHPYFHLMHQSASEPQQILYSPQNLIPINFSGRWIQVILMIKYDSSKMLDAYSKYLKTTDKSYWTNYFKNTPLYCYFDQTVKIYSLGVSMGLISSIILQPMGNIIGLYIYFLLSYIYFQFVRDTALSQFYGENRDMFSLKKCHNNPTVHSAQVCIDRRQLPC